MADNKAIEALTFEDLDAANEQLAQMIEEDKALAATGDDVHRTAEMATPLTTN